ncbi:MAG: SLC13 family permease [Planctomycetes bacterium]|nr:SLC13 family permease [Planctomycetota bacterium]
MTAASLTALTILGVAMVLFVRGTWRHDVVAFGALMAAVCVGVVDADRALRGFGHPAVFTVAAVLVISRALQISGALDGIAERLARLEQRPGLQLAALTGLATGLSTVMNNVGALALVMPLAMETSARSGRPPSRVLLPIAFGAILGGLGTLIGTPPNLVVSLYRAERLGEGFAMFEYLPLGLPIALAGGAFLLGAAPRLLAGRDREGRPTAVAFEVEKYVTELRVAHGSRLIGQTLAELADPAERDLEVLGLVRSEVPLFQSIFHLPLRPGDVLVLRAHSRTFERLARIPGLEHVPTTTDADAEPAASAETGVVEVVVPVGSRMEGRTPRSLRLHTRMGINILAIGRRGRPFADRLGDVVLRAGDVLLLQGDREKIAETSQTYGCLPLAERDLRMTKPRHRHLPALLFLAAIALTATHALPVHIAFGLAVVGLVVSQSFTIRQLYETIDWSVIVLLAAMIPLGEALETTGATAAIAGWLAGSGGGAGAIPALALLLATTALLTNFVNNAATAVVMAPIGFELATELHWDPDPFLMAVTVGASCAFVTPIGHQNSVLIMGPGGYSFGDFARVGLPLTLVVFAVAIPAIALLWPPTR